MAASLSVGTDSPMERPRLALLSVREGNSVSSSGAPDAHEVPTTYVHKAKCRKLSLKNRASWHPYPNPSVLKRRLSPSDVLVGIEVTASQL